jgi:hypothetical protein
VLRVNGLGCYLDHVLLIIALVLQYTKLIHSSGPLPLFLLHFDINIGLSFGCLELHPVRESTLRPHNS